MKLVRWKRFTWDLAKLPSAPTEGLAQFRTRTAVHEDKRAVSDVILHAFSTDNCWSDLLSTLQPRLQAEIDAAFAATPIPILVITHGSRVIGASLLDLEIEAENHLTSGPCIISEYRSRGLGTLLLHGSLQMLREHGLTRVHGISKEIAPASKFVYRKFGAVGADYDYEPSPARA